MNGMGPTIENAATLKQSQQQQKKQVGPIKTAAKQPQQVGPIKTAKQQSANLNNAGMPPGPTLTAAQQQQLQANLAKLKNTQKNQPLSSTQVTDPVLNAAQKQKILDDINVSTTKDFLDLQKKTEANRSRKEKNTHNEDMKEERLERERFETKTDKLDKALDTGKKGASVGRSWANTLRKWGIDLRKSDKR